MRILLLAALLPLTACQSEPAAMPLTPKQSAAFTPKDARIAKLYEQSCKSCHTTKDTGAPLTGDRTLWSPRWEKGEAELLKSALGGLRGMPAGGQCFSCTPKDHEQLIQFMAGRE
jgi:cytochrome c5